MTDLPSKPIRPVVYVRCSEEEHREITARAAAARQSASRYLVECALRGRRPRLRAALPPDPEARALLEGLLFQLRKVGVNLNQLAQGQHSSLHMGAEPPTDVEIRSVSAALRMLMEQIEDRL